MRLHEIVRTNNKKQNYIVLQKPLSYYRNHKEYSRTQMINDYLPKGHNLTSVKNISKNVK